MSKQLNRLEDLENEIHLLLNLQKEQCKDIQDLMPSFTHIPDTFTTAQTLRTGNANNTIRTGSVNNATRTGSANNATKTGSANNTRNSVPTKYPVPTDNAKNACACDNLSYSEEKRINVSSYSRKSMPKAYKGPRKKTHEDKDKLVEAYGIITQLQNELQSTKMRTTTMSRDVAMLTKTLQALRTKYKMLKASGKENAAQLDELKRINTELCRKLDCELKNRAEKIQNAKEQAAESQNKAKEDALLLLNQSQEHQQRLQEANERLAKNSQELSAQLVEAAKEIERLKNDINQQTDSLKCICRENDDLKMNLNNERNKNEAITNGVNMLEVKISDMIDVERKSQKEVILLKSKIMELEQVNEENNNNVRQEEYEAIKCECEFLKQKIVQLGTDDNKRCQVINGEMEKLANAMKNRELMMMKEKCTLKQLVEELSEVVKSHKSRIQDLVAINKQQEALLQSQFVILHSKDEQIRLAETETEVCKQKTHDLKKEIGMIKESIKTSYKTDCNCKEKLSVLQQELINARHELQEKRDKLLVKEKIINDQADTIGQLKEVRVSKNNEQIAKLQQKLEIEKHDKEILLVNIRELERHKDQLKNQIAKLSEELTEKSKFPARTTSQLEKQKKMLQSLEQQVARKQCEWKLQCEQLKKEKEKAMEAARFATQKLRDTVTDFQMQTNSQKKVQQVLATIMQKKNSQLRCACQQVGKTNERLRQQNSPETNEKDLTDGNSSRKCDNKNCK